MEHVSNHLNAYLDDQLSPVLRAQIETHLSLCPDCLYELRALQQTSAALRQLPLPTPSPIFLNRLHTSIESAARRPIIIATERLIGLLSGVAACLALVGGLLLLQPRASTASSVPAAWERDAVQFVDESDNTPETAMGQWMIASLSAHDAASQGGKSQ